jgi:hypothetical protein
MSESKKRSIAMVMGAMLVGILVGGVIWARPDQRAQAADSTRRVTVPAAFFHPNDEGLDYLNNGNYVEIESGQGIFTAPVVFPCLPSVTVERIILSVRDQNGTGIGNACVSLYRETDGLGVLLGLAAGHHQLHRRHHRLPRGLAESGSLSLAGDLRHKHRSVRRADRVQEKHLSVVLW